MSARLAALAVLFLASSAVAADFIGPEACRACHLAAYDVWSKSPHAQAMKSLSPADQKNGTCLACHAPDLAKGGDAGVTCESCHGAGQYYAPQYVMKDPELARATGLVVPDANSCLLCHDAQSPSLQPFDPTEKMKAIDHWTADRAAQKAKGEKAQACPRSEGKLAAVRPGEGFLAQALTAKPRTDAGRAAVVLAKAARSQRAQ